MGWAPGASTRIEGERGVLGALLPSVATAGFACCLPSMVIRPPRARCGPAQLSLAAPTHPPARTTLRVDQELWTAVLLGAEPWVRDVSTCGTGHVKDQNVPLATFLDRVNISCFRFSSLASWHHPCSVRQDHPGRCWRSQGDCLPALCSKAKNALASRLTSNHLP